MKLKLDDSGNAVLQDGKPVYVKDDGKEVAFDAAATMQTISRLNGEAKGHRERAEAAEATLKTFEGIDDPDAAKKALATVKNLDDKKLVDAGQVETVKQEAIKAVHEQYKPIVAERDQLAASLNTEMIGGRFKGSKFISDKLTVPVPMVEKTFGSNFKIEDGKVVAYDGNGQKIYSGSKPGELADFDEALGILVDASPYKDSILKAASASGGDVNRDTGGGDRNMKKGNMGGTREERTAALASRFPELAKNT